MTRAQYARQYQIPYLGLCLGLQVMVIDWARNVLGLAGANSAELDPETPHPVIHIMPEQEAVTNLGGTMRLGGYPCRPQRNSRTMSAYRNAEVEERHRHRFEVNNRYREGLEASGMLMGGLSPDGQLVETAGSPGTSLYGGGAVSSGVSIPAQPGRIRCSATLSPRPGKPFGRARSRRCWWRGNPEPYCRQS